MKKLLYVGNHLHNSRSNPTFSAVLGPLLEGSGYQVRYTSSATNKGWRLLEMLWTTFKTRKVIDLVLIDTYSTQNFYYAVLVAQLCQRMNVPYIPILHGGNLTHRLKHAPHRSRKLFGRAQVNVSPSLYLKHEFARFGYHNVVHIPNTIAIENYPCSKKSFDTPRLLWVRSFSEIYNPSLAVEVLHELRHRGYHATLCMVGPDTDGSLAKVKVLAEHLNVRVDFTGKLSKTEWLVLSKTYNVFLNTTNVDNMPLSVIEAMALGLPVVSTNVGGLPYLMESGVEGLLVPPNDKMAMVDAIGSLFENVDQTKLMVGRARAKAEGFDWQQVVWKWKEVLGQSA